MATRHALAARHQRLAPEERVGRPRVWRDVVKEERGVASGWSTRATKDSEGKQAARGRKKAVAAAAREERRPARPAARVAPGHRYRLQAAAVHHSRGSRKVQHGGTAGPTLRPATHYHHACRHPVLEGEKEREGGGGREGGEGRGGEGEGGRNQQKKKA